MDTIATFDKVAGFLGNPPTMAPHLDFAKLQTLCQHIVKALKHIKCSQSFIYGWLGLAMALAMCALLKPNAFVLLVDWGPAPVYTPFMTPAAIKMVMQHLRGTRVILCPTRISITRASTCLMNWYLTNTKC